jgi:lysyl-tRNA synthetase, class II
MTWQPSRLEKERLEKAERLQERDIELYPRRIKRTHTSAQAITAFEQLEAQNPDSADGQLEVTVTGRIRRANIKGKVSFMHIEDESGRLQLFLRINDMDENIYGAVKEKLIDMDDFVQASGTMMRTRTGEASVRVSDLVLLSKTISPLPVVKQEIQEDGTIVEHGEFKDVETRYRQRYADLAVNQNVREVFRKRAKTVSAIRRFFDDEDFLEVETPILQPVYGGAAARPFTTYHNQLGQDLFLRISFELYLKRLLVGGYDAVYEIGRDFRNEGVSYKHNPEFTQIEFYKAYIDYNGVMDLTERMVAYVAERVTGGTKVVYQEQEIDFTPPWPRVKLRDAIMEYAGIDYMDHVKDGLGDSESLAQAMTDMKKTEKSTEGKAWGKLIDDMIGDYVEPKLIQPTILYDYPHEISPFAKRVDYDDFHVERFEFFIHGMEMGNAFTELNDPQDQEQRFLDMQKLYGDEGDEATPIDEDYLRSMRYGMPPNGGFGMGVDRLVMLLTDQRSIRDVLLYPHLREEK